MTNNTNTQNNKIEDFGQKIGGARKDIYAEAREWAAGVAAIDAQKLASAGLSKLVKRPNLERMTTTGAISRSTAAAAWAIWRTIGRAPSWCSMTWASNTAAAINSIAELLTTNPDTLPDELTARADYRVIMATEWPAVPFSFGKYSITQYNSGLLRINDGHYYYGDSSTDPANIAAQLSQMVEADIAKAAAKRANGPRLAIYRNRAGLYFVAPDDKAEIVIKTFETYTAARDYIVNNRAEALERYAALRTFPALRRDWNRPRVGQDWRGGIDTTPETFAAVLPFRGVEFGNWVNQTERAALLNSAFDGFHDLASVLNIAPAAVTLSGSLAFAFGARGHSNAAAHYEPEKVVINLTKKNGAGCMAHEWFHAVDNYAAGGGLDNYATEGSANPAAAAILQAIKKMDYYKRSENLANFKGDYWTSGRELTARAFECVIMALLPYNGIVSDFLANVVDFDDFTAKDIAHRCDFYPYPTADEAAALLPLYLDFLRSVFGDGVNVNPAALADSERAQKKAEAERIEAERIREERRRAEEEEIARRRAEKEAARERAAAQMKENAESSRAALVDVLTAAHFDQIATGFDSASVYAVAHLGGYLWTISADIKTANEQGRDYIAAQPMARINYKYCHNAKRIIARTWQKNEIKSSSRTAAEFVREKLADSPAEVRSIASSFNSSANTNTWQEAAKLYNDTQRAAAELMNRHATAKTTDTTPDTSEAPAEGLELVEIPAGLAVVGDSRTTYRNRKAIKAHGATWNKDAQQWQATTPEACAALRGWFALSTATDTATAAEQLPEPPAVVTIDETPDQEQAPTAATAAAIDAWQDASAAEACTPSSQKTTASHTPSSQKTTDPAAMGADLLRALMDTTSGFDVEELRTMAHGVAIAPTNESAAAMVEKARQTAGAMLRRAAQINEVLKHFMDGVSADDWNEYEVQASEFENLADDLISDAYAIAQAVGVAAVEVDQLADLPATEETHDPAQLAMAFDDSPAVKKADTPDEIIINLCERIYNDTTEAVAVGDAVIYNKFKGENPRRAVITGYDDEIKLYFLKTDGGEFIATERDGFAPAGPTPTNEKTAPTDTEVLETAARIRANYEAMKAEAEQPAATLPDWAKEFAPVTYTHHGRTLTGYIMNIHKAFRGNRYICTFNEKGTLFTTFVSVSDCTPLLEAA